MEVDDDLLERARGVAGTMTIKEIVHVALERLADDETALRHIERPRGAGALDPVAVGEARRPRAGR